MNRRKHSHSSPFLFVAALSAALFVSGCATLFSGSSSDVEFQSTPSEAEIQVDGTRQGTTPATLEIKRPEQGEAPEIILDREGYEEKTLTLQKKFNPITLLNIINPFNYVLGVPVLGFAVDWYTGALWKYEPTTYSTDLTEGGESASVVPSKQNNVRRYKLSDLPKDKEGHYVVPAHDQPVAIIDSETGSVYTFK